MCSRKEIKNKNKRREKPLQSFQCHLWQGKKIDKVVGENFTGKKKNMARWKGESHEIWNSKVYCWRVKGQERTQTISDFVDSRRGGHEEQSLEGSKLPVGLNSNCAMRFAWAPWLIPPLVRVQNELLRLVLRLRLLFKIFVMIKLRLHAPIGRFWCWGFLHSKSSQQKDLNPSNAWVTKQEKIDSTQLFATST